MSKTPETSPAPETAEPGGLPQLVDTRAGIYPDPAVEPVPDPPVTVRLPDGCEITVPASEAVFYGHRP